MMTQNDKKKIEFSLDLNNLSYDELKEVYSTIHSDSKDEWFPIMFVTDECPHCGGEAHQFENYKQGHMQIRCFNSTCVSAGKVVGQYVKGDDFYRMAIGLHLGVEI